MSTVRNDLSEMVTQRAHEAAQSPQSEASLQLGSMIPA